MDLEQNGPFSDIFFIMKKGKSDFFHPNTSFESIDPIR